MLGEYTQSQFFMKNKKIIALFQVLLLSICFVLAQKPVNLTTSDLPILIIETHGAKIVQNVKVTGTLAIINNKTGLNKITDAPNDYNGNIGIAIRGNSSASWDNKPYSVELRNQDGTNNNQSILGLPSENDWVLHPPWVDKTLMRNALVYDLFRELGWYAPRNAFCEIIVNGDYKGVYLLVEKLKVDKNRLNIAKPNANNVTGGYLLEMTTIARLDDDEPYVHCVISDKPLAILSPKVDELTAAHRSYIETYLNQFESALYNRHYTGPNSYRNYIDVPSFIDHMLVHEVIRELDVFCASEYFYKEMDGKLKMGPAWDFNRALGNFSGANEYKVDDIWMTSTARGSCKIFWGKYLYEDPAFKAEFIERYKVLRTNVLSNANFNAKIDAYMQILDKAKDRNYTRWDYALTTKYNQPQPAWVDTFEEEIDYVRNWLASRLNWLDNEWKLIKHPVVTEIYADGTNTGNQWIELFNPFNTTISLSGWQIAINNNEYIYTFPTTASIAANAYIVVCVNKDGFMAKYPDVKASHVFEGFSFDLLNDDITIAIRNLTGNMLNEIKASVMNGWPTLSRSGNHSVGLSPFLPNNTVGHNWNWSKNAGGTPGAANELFNYKGLVISEVMTSNKAVIADEYGEYEDWVELYNSSNHAINLAGLCVSNNTAKPWKFKFKPSVSPSTMLYPNECVLVWADEDVDQGIFHADFKLTRDEAEDVVLSYYDGFKYRTIDALSVANLLTDQSLQRVSLEPSKWLVSNEPTPGEYRITTNVPVYSYANMKVKLFPNPTRGQFNIDIQLAESAKMDIKLFDISGVQIKVIESFGRVEPGHYSFNVSIADNMKPGVYIVEIKVNSIVSRQRLVVY